MLIILFKTVIISLLVFFVLRLMGKRQIGEMQPFELVITLILAEVACLPMNDPAIPLYNGLVPIIALTFLHVLITFIARKSIMFRKVVDGSSVIVIDRGSIVYDNLRKLNMNMHDLVESARSGGHPDIIRIQYGIVETNGQLSVIEKAEDETNLTGSLFPMALIMDGIRLRKNFEVAGLTDTQVTEFLKINGLKNDGEVLYLDVRQDGKIYMGLKKGGFKLGDIQIGGNW